MLGCATAGCWRPRWGAPALARSKARKVPARLPAPPPRHTRRPAPPALPRLPAAPPAPAGQRGRGGCGRQGDPGRREAGGSRRGHHAAPQRCGVFVKGARCEERWQWLTELALGCRVQEHTRARLACQRSPTPCRPSPTSLPAPATPCADPLALPPVPPWPPLPLLQATWRCSTWGSSSPPFPARPPPPARLAPPRAAPSRRGRVGGGGQC